MEPVAPDREILNRLRNEFLTANGSTGLYWTGSADLTQYHHYFAARIGWKWDAANAQAQQVGWRPESPKVLDWGCGTGIASLRLLEHFGSSGIDELFLWDHSAAATSFAREIIQRAHPDLKVTIAQDLSALPLDETLCLASHVLNELSWADRESLNLLFAQSRQIFWVEPGSYESSRQLLEQRERLLDRFDPVAPCVCPMPCPMVRDENAKHWCHFFAKAPVIAFTDRNWTRFAQMMEIDLRSLPYSFIVLNEKSLPPLPSLAGKSRLLGRPRQHKGYTRLYSCDSNGHNDYELWQRDDKALWKAIKKGKSGTLFRWNAIESGKIKSGRAVENQID